MEDATVSEQIRTCEQQSGFSVSVYDGVMVKFVFCWQSKEEVV